MACVLVAVRGSKTLVTMVDPGPVGVPWACGVLATSGPAGALLSGDACRESTESTVGYGETTDLGGLVTSCHEAVPAGRGMHAIRFGGHMVAASESMARVFHELSVFAPSREPVLILGESGTGKELTARAIHDLGPGHGAPFVAVNMAAIPDDLAEAELFGWVRGAFTGASDTRAGAFEAAGRGTLFLDEIGEASPALQAKVLRAVESGTVTPVGSRKPVATHARILTATNTDLRSAVSRGRFRLDLLQRLACLVVRIPPLRERREDVPVIAESFCRTLPGAPELANDARELLERHDWPGNARELRNVVVRASLCSPGGVLDGAAFRDSMAASPLGFGPIEAAGNGMHVLPARVTRGHQIAMSGLPRSTFYYRLKRGRIATA